VSARSLDHLLTLLQRSPRGAVFNPWWQSDEENDIGPRAPDIRREQFRAYVAGRLGKARLALVGEALGYRGGHFTGVAMTSERILLEGVEGRCVLSGIVPRRTSRPDKWPRAFAEPTASIVWNALLGLGLSAEAFVLWNAFPWHPFDRDQGMLSNRKPTRAELAAGALVLKAFLDLFREARLVAVGRLAASQLASEECVRHPASAGAALFRRQIAAIVRS
jgi:uracil-DNA glycosylase